ncbi:MAG: hypothetical protein QOI82_1371 [Actinomycetota bacterium]|jgi:hypothetical protein|nr:hypothetical protein [Actinomycetota bacterium]
MTPLDDELRSLLHTRADHVAPAADPLSGIERRAKQLRRNRVGASVAGAALAVAAIAVAVPALVPDRHDASQVAVTPPPSATPSASGAVGPNELDAGQAWDYRGDPAVIAPGQLRTLRSEWQASHAGARLTPLFGEVYEPSGKPEVVFVSASPNGDNVWGYATTSEAGWQFSHLQPLAAHTKVLMLALAGDEAPRLLVVAAPSTGGIRYAPDGSSFREITLTTQTARSGSSSSVETTVDGIGITALEGDTTHDVVQVLDGDGDMDHPAFEGPAPDAVHSSGPLQSYKPANYLEWQTRGTVDARTEDQAVSAFAQAKGTTPDHVGHHVLWGGTDKGGRNLVFMEAWVAGDSAQTFGFVSTGEPFLGPVLGKSPDVLAYLASGAPGTGSDVLVILPRLGAGPFSYAASASAPYREVGNARSDMANVAVIDRDPKASSDKLKVLDGDGMKVLYDGPVQPLLCGASGCG